MAFGHGRAPSLPPPLTGGWASREKLTDRKGRRGDSMATRLPEGFMFQLSTGEMKSLILQSVRAKG
jgi:hypothetical protein